MPRGIWSKKDERQYEAILKSCRKSAKKKGKSSRYCKGMAAAVVNRKRASEGRTKKYGSWGIFIVPAKLPRFDAKKLGLRRSSKKECLVKSGPRKGMTKRGCVWGWGKFRGKLFKKKG